MSPIVTAALIIIGNEILTGRTRDANLPYLAGRLDGIGVRLREVRVVPDDEAAIATAVNELRAVHDYVFTTGGVGPTHDDITAASLAKAFGVPVERNAGAVARLEAYYADRELVPHDMLAEVGKAKNAERRAARAQAVVDSPS